jgi:hypothetical protein
MCIYFPCIGLVSRVVNILNGFVPVAGEVRDKVTKAYEAANKVIVAAKSRSVFDGKPANVDEALVAALRETVATFKEDAVMPGVTPSPSYADKLKSLQELAVAQWKEAHQLNKAAHQLKRTELQSVTIPAVEF